MSITSIYEASRRSLSNQQAAINVTAQNITNANNENFSRRKIDFNFKSTGISSQNVERVHDKFLENQIRLENQEYGRANVQSSLFKNVEIIFGEPGEGSLSSVMEKFWNSWDELSNDPESEVKRILVGNSGEQLANSFNSLNDRMENLSRESASMAQDKVTKVNALIDQLGVVNRTANRSAELLDKEDIIINDLSKLINIQIKEDETGRKSVRSGGYSLINGSEVTKFSVSTVNSDSLQKLEITTERGDKVNINSGELGGVLEFNNEYLKSYKNDIDVIAKSIIDKVNEKHSTGYGLNNSTGNNFFAGTKAKDIQLNKNLKDDFSLIATSSAQNTIGDGSIAQEIANIRSTLDDETGRSIDDNYQILVTNISVDGNKENFISQNQDKIITQLRAQKASYSGVSLDEEMTNLLKYERAYQAAAKVAQAVDEIMKTILQLV